MKEWITWFLSSNSVGCRLGRTILQSVVGILIANIDLIVGAWSFDPAFKPMIVAMVMAVLSPVMAILGEANKGEPHESN